jgi:hypothetical protein
MNMTSPGRASVTRATPSAAMRIMRWVTGTPLAGPVVPEVYMSAKRASGAGGGPRARPGRRAAPGTRRRGAAAGARRRRRRRRRGEVGLGDHQRRVGMIEDVAQPRPLRLGVDRHPDHPGAASARIVSTASSELRSITATTAPGRSPRAASPEAIAAVRRSRSPKRSAASSKRAKTRSGRSRARVSSGSRKPPGGRRVDAHLRPRCAMKASIIRAGSPVP